MFGHLLQVSKVGLIFKKENNLNFWQHSALQFAPNVVNQTRALRVFDSLDQKCSTKPKDMIKWSNIIVVQKRTVQRGYSVHGPMNKHTCLRAGLRKCTNNTNAKGIKMSPEEAKLIEEFKALKAKYPHYQPGDHNVELIVAHKKYKLTQRWQTIKGNRFYIDNFSCQRCYNKDVPLCIHYKTYDHLFDEYDPKHLREDLVTLCFGCQKEWYIKFKARIVTNADFENFLKEEDELDMIAQFVPGGI